MMNNRKSARSVSVSLLLVLALGMCVLGCNTTPSPSASVSSWIRAHALPLATTDPQASLDDLRQIPELVGTASIVGLGEETHGSHEFFTMKQRLLEVLVEKMGFTLFAMECSVSVGQLINTYVLTGQGNDRILLHKLLLWPWQTHEVLDLIDWMRAYNADPSHPDKVHFAGFDPQGIDTNTYDEVMGYLQTVDPQRLTTVASLYSGLRPTPGGSYDTYLNAYLAQPPDIKERYLHQAQQVYDLLAQQQTGYEATTSPQAYAHALYAARVIVQFAQLMSIDSTQTEVYGQQRDAFLGEDAAWLHDHAQGGHKVVLWAHNGHVQTQAYTGITRMGMYLRQRYHSDYVAVGMSFYQGSFNAVGVMSNGAFTGLHEFTLPAPDHGSYNDVFGHTGLSLYALDLRHLPHDAVGNWLAGPHPFLLIGATYDSDATRTSSYWPYESVSLPQTFDVIIHIQKVTASSLLLV